MLASLPRGRLRRIGHVLRDEGNLLDVLLDSVDVAVVACGVDGQPTHVNGRAVELMGMDGSAGSAPDTWIEQSSPRTPDGRAMALIDLPITRALRGEVVRDVDLLVTTAHGDVLMSTNANPIYNEKGGRLGAVAVFADVTERRAREARVREELRSLGVALEVKEALDEGRLLMYAQPIVDLRTGETVLDELL